MLVVMRKGAPEDQLRGFRGVYLETAQRLKEQQGKGGDDPSDAQQAIEQLEFEFVLFSSAIGRYSEVGDWTVVPEPGTALLTMLGLSGLASRSRRTR